VTKKRKTNTDMVYLSEGVNQEVASMTIEELLELSGKAINDQVINTGGTEDEVVLSRDL
jgi:hypothetical protein